MLEHSENTSHGLRPISQTICEDIEIIAPAQAVYHSSNLNYQTLAMSFWFSNLVRGHFKEPVSTLHKQISIKLLDFGSS